jgi:hypothetical protein
MAGRAGLSGWWGGPWPPPPGGAVTPSRNPCPEGAGALGRGVAPPPGEGPSARARARAKRRGHLLGRAAREGGPKAGGGATDGVRAAGGGRGPEGLVGSLGASPPRPSAGAGLHLLLVGATRPPRPSLLPAGVRGCAGGRVGWPPQLAGGGIAGLLPATLAPCRRHGAHLLAPPTRWGGHRGLAARDLANGPCTPHVEDEGARAPPRSRRRGHACPPRPKAGAVAMDRAADGPRPRRALARARRELPGALSKSFIGTRANGAATYIELRGRCGTARDVGHQPPRDPHQGVATWPPGRAPRVGVAGGPRRRPLRGRPRNIANRGQAARDQANPREAPAPPPWGWEGRRHNGPAKGAGGVAPPAMRGPGAPHAAQERTPTQADEYIFVPILFESMQ